MPQRPLHRLARAAVGALPSPKLPARATSGARGLSLVVKRKRATSPPCVAVSNACFKAEAHSFGFLSEEFYEVLDFGDLVGARILSSEGAPP